MIKILAVDMDGTCLDSKGQMSRVTLDALRRAGQSGILVVPTTGRSINCLPGPLKNEPFYRYIISSNGSVVFDTEEKKELFTACIDCETALQVLDKCKGMITFKAAHIDKDIYTQGRFLQYMVKRFFKDSTANIVYVRSLKDFIKKNCKRVEEFQFFYKNEGYRSRIKTLMRDMDGICSAHSKGYAEIYNEKGSKGTALIALGESLGITCDEIACIGDEENDVSMFEVVGTPLAMGNAIQTLKDMSKEILPTNDENGVAWAIDNIILKNNKTV